MNNDFEGFKRFFETVTGIPWSDREKAFKGQNKCKKREGLSPSGLDANKKEFTERK